MKIKLWDEFEGCFLDCNEDASLANDLMLEVGVDPKTGFAGIGVMSDGQPVIFNKDGNYTYLDANRYKPVQC
jgi:hypothetical protein